MRQPVMTTTSVEQVGPVPCEPPSAPLEGRFRRAFEDSASGMALIEGRGAAAGRFLEVNPELIRISGYTGEELLGMRYCELLHPDDAEAMRAGVADLFAGR